MLDDDLRLVFADIPDGQLGRYIPGTKKLEIDSQLIHEAFLELGDFRRAASGVVHEGQHFLEDARQVLGSASEFIDRADHRQAAFQRRMGLSTDLTRAYEKNGLETCSRHLRILRSKGRMNLVADLAENELQCTVRCLETISIGKSSVSIWTPKDAYPKTRIAICEDSEPYVISNGFSSLQRFLKTAKLPIGQVNELTNSLKYILPASVRILTGEISDYVKEATGHRSEPEFDGEVFGFFCNDFVAGKVLSCSIDHAFVLTYEEVGKGVQM